MIDAVVFVGYNDYLQSSYNNIYSYLFGVTTLVAVDDNFKALFVK